jgi:hypothetical protein
VIKFVSDLRQVGGFSASPPVSSTNKTERHDITEILLKVALNTISNKQTNNQTIVEILSLLVNSGEQIINCRLKQGYGKT